MECELSNDDVIIGDDPLVMVMLSAKEPTVWRHLNIWMCR